MDTRLCIASILVLAVILLALKGIAIIWAQVQAAIERMKRWRQIGADLNDDDPRMWP